MSAPPVAPGDASSIANNTGMDALMDNVNKRGLEIEIKRLADAHKMYTEAAGGKLSFLPIDWTKPGLRILDSGTGDGIWLKALRDQIGAEVAAQQTHIGTDLVEGFFHEPDREGIQFVKQSITESWPQEWQGAFDVVHQRQVLGFCGFFGLDKAVANLCKLAKPGGWVELVELNCDSSSLPDGTPGKEFFQLLEQIWVIRKMGGNFGPNLKGWMEAAGLEDVTVDVLNCKVGKSARLPELSEASINAAVGAGPMIFAMAKTLPELQGFTHEQLDTLNARLRKQLTEEGGEFQSLAVRGRVPAGGLKQRN